MDRESVEAQPKEAMSEDQFARELKKARTTTERIAVFYKLIGGLAKDELRARLARLVKHSGSAPAEWPPRIH